MIIIEACIALTIKKKLKVQRSYDDELNIIQNEFASKSINFSASDYKYDEIKINTRYGELKLNHYFSNNKKTVIFVHGIMSNKFTLLKNIEYWRSRGFSVIAYDNFGYGESQKFGSCTMGKKESKLLFDIVSWAKQTLNNHELYLFGESMGGATVYTYLSKYGNKNIKKIVVDAGFFSLVNNGIIFARDIIKIGKFAYIAYPLLWLMFMLARLPFTPRITKHKLKKMNNVLHIHSKEDTMVMFDHVKKYKKILGQNFYTYKTPNVRHVRGCLDAPKELSSKLDSWFEVTKI